MSKPKSYKLSEVAISFERSIATVVADLQALGFSVENKPNARISEEAYAALGQKYGRPVKSKDVPAPPPPTPPQPEEPSLPAEESSLPVVGKVDLPSPRRRLPPPPQKPRPLITSPVGSSTPSTALPSDSPAPPPQEASLTPFQAEVPSPSEVSTSTSPPVIETSDSPLPAEAIAPQEAASPASSAPSIEPSSPTKEDTPLVEAPIKILGKISLDDKKESRPRPRERIILKDLTPPAHLSHLASSKPAEAQPEEIEKDTDAESPEPRSKRKRKRKKRAEITAAKVSTSPLQAPKTSEKRPVKAQIKATGDVATRRRLRQEKLRQKEKKREAALAAEAASATTIEIAEYITAAELAQALQVPVTQVIAKCLELGYPTSINQRLERDLAAIIAEEFGYQVRFVSLDETLEQLTSVDESPEDLIPRPPIVTIMGHVDHGKTTLLDYIRNTNVVAGEAGGITQHIGAYEVELPSGHKITFLDTPGHEAFTAMRARGAQVTDIAVIVVAADDHVRPQTLEALSHAQAANVPILFAINKIDKDTANPDRIRQELAEAGFLVEEWGGPYMSQLISAKKGIGVQELLEKILVMAELMELKANPNRPAKGTVIEAQLDKARGPVATLLVQTGTLRIGDMLLAGEHYGRVRALFDERGRRLSEAGPSKPVQVLGLSGVPDVGERFYVLEEEALARDMAHRRAELRKEHERRRLSASILEGIASGQAKQLNLIVKADVSGSLEALTDALVKLSTSEVQVNIIHRAVGQITDSDVLLAKASNALIVGFQVRPSHTARQLAKQNNVEIRLYNVIYDIIDEIKGALSGMLAPIIQEQTIGTAEVREIFKIPKVGTVAGCKVIEGKILRGAKAHLIREGVVLYTSSIASLKRFKDDVKEVAEGLECGLTLEGFQDIKPGDLIECFEEIQVKRSL
jgi:translation initiation factor IF-2